MNWKRHFKMLTEIEIAKFERMSEKEIEVYLQTHDYMNHQPNFSQIQVGRKLYVVNGCWYGIVKDDGYMYVYEDSYFTVLNTKYKFHPTEESCRLDFYYLDEEVKYREIHAILHGKTLPVFSGSADCSHILMPITYSGLTCIKCGGVYCA